MKRSQFVTLDMLSNNLVKYKNTWIINCKISSIDIEMRTKEEKLIIMEVFKKVISSFHTTAQVTMRKFPLDFSAYIDKIKNNVASMPNYNLKIYSSSYVEYIERLSVDKLDKVNYLTIRTDRMCSQEEAESYLVGIVNQIRRELEQLSMEVEIINGNNLMSLYHLPSFIKEEVDYYIFGKEYRRTYVILDYPHNAYPNFLRPLLTFPRPIEITQHYNPYPRDKVVHSLEKAVAKLESTINMQSKIGLPSTEIVKRKNDATELLNRIAGGEDNIIETGVYVTICANSLDQLSNWSYELEGALRQMQVGFRRSTKDNNKAMISSMLLCDDRLQNDNYTFDTLSLSRLVPFTTQDYSSGGVLYGINEQLNELITFDIFNAMASYTKVVLGKPGYGKSVLAKLEMGRQLANGVQVIGIDHNNEYREVCKVWGGQYVEGGGKPNWNHHMIIFSGDNKSKDLSIILDYLHNSKIRPRIVTIDEFQVILRENKSLVLNLVQTVRKTFTSPTLITQNIQELFCSDEGRMIVDNATMKFLMHQGENDVAAMEGLFDLTRDEKIYLKTIRPGYGYLITDLFRTKFKAACSETEYSLVTTNPNDKIKRMV